MPTPASRASAASLTRPFLILTALFLLTLPLVTTRMYASDEVQYFSYLRSLWFDRDVSFGNEYQHFYDSGVVRYPLFRETFLEGRTETGRHITFATIGSAILWSPFYAVADVTVRARRAMGATIEADGFSHPYVAAVAYGSAIYGWLTLVLSMLIVRRVLGARPDDAALSPSPAPPPSPSSSPSSSSPTPALSSTPPAAPSPSRAPLPSSSPFATRAEAGDAAVGWLALGAALAVWVGTPLFFYMYIAPPMSHACSAFAVALFVLTWLHVRARWSLRGLVLLGALAALMAMVREQDLFVVIGPAIDWLWTMVRMVVQRTRGRAGRAGQTAHAPHAVLRLSMHALAGAAAFAIAFTPQLAAYTALHGYPGPSRLVTRKMYWMAPHAWGVLASPQHGLLFWTPLVALALIGLCILARRGARPANTETPETPTRATMTSTRGWTTTGGLTAGTNAARIGVCLLLIVAAQVYVAGSVESWTVAGAFGQRRFVALTAVFALGLATFVRSLPPRWPRRVGLTVAALAIWWNLGLMAQFGAGLMDRQRLELGRNAYHTFVTIPRRLPELIYRYLFERRSFFKAPGSPSAGVTGMDGPENHPENRPEDRTGDGAKGGAVDDATDGAADGATGGRA